MWAGIGRPLTQQQLPWGLLGWLLAAGPEVALGISDLEARLLPDGGGGGTWGNQSPPGGGLSCGQEVVGPGLQRECLGVRGCQGGGGPPLPPCSPCEA